MKLIVPLADPHCGAIYGLTPPEYWLDIKCASGVTKIWAKIQRHCWKQYMQTRDAVMKIGKPDVVIPLGDLIHGRREAWIPDRKVQCEMAAECLAVWGCKKYHGVYGSEFHVASDGEDWEDVAIAYLKDRLLTNGVLKPKITLASREFLKAEGIIIEVRHHVGRSSIPHGWATPLLRDTIVRNTLVWAHSPDDPLEPRANLFLRGHTHTYGMLGGWNNGPWRAFILPALATCYPKKEEKYVRRISQGGPIHFGVVPLIIEGNETRPIEKYISVVTDNRAEVIKI